MSLTSYRAAPPRVKPLAGPHFYAATLARTSCSKRPLTREVRSGVFFAILSFSIHRSVMHGFLEAHMGEKPALQPKAAIGPAVRAIAVAVLAEARAVIADPER